jgi:hypothetical protein
LPDVTNDEISLGRSELLDKILYKASGRKIVFLGGAINGKKNISCWSNVIETMNPAQWFFILVGYQDRSTFTNEDLWGIERVHSRENVFIYDHYVQDERELNLIISNSNIIFGVYRNFQGSSNMLAKSASFSVPIVVSSEFEMGNRVREYGIGYCVEENDHLEIATVIERSSSVLIPRSSFNRYSDAYSRSGFAEALDDFVTEAISMGNR